MTNPDYYTRGLIVSAAIAGDATLRVEFDSGVHDLKGADLASEWRGLAPGETFEILGRVGDDGELQAIDWHAHDGAPNGYRVGRVGLEAPTGEVVSLPAYVSAWERWNGFALPLFTREGLIENGEALRRIFLAGDSGLDEGYVLTFDADGFPSLKDLEYLDDGDLIAPVEIDGRTLYDVGGGGFVWQDA